MRNALCNSMAMHATVPVHAMVTSNFETLCALELLSLACKRCAALRYVATPELLVPQQCVLVCAMDEEKTHDHDCDVMDELIWS